jgi:hypothetical protein
MPVTTIKRCQSEPEWWWTVEDCFAECDVEPGSGLTIKYHDDNDQVGEIKLSLSKADAFLIRDAINQLYPLS